MTARWFLFGSRARHEHRLDSDIDVFIVCEDNDKLPLKELWPYALETGGKLDLFSLTGDCLWAVFNEERKILLDRHWSSASIFGDSVEITYDQLLTMLKEVSGYKVRSFGGYFTRFPPP